VFERIVPIIHAHGRHVDKYVGDGLLAVFGRAQTTAGLGGAGRLEFSVIGDAVNVAAPVEATTRETGDTVLVSEHTRALLSDSRRDLAPGAPGGATEGQDRGGSALRARGHREDRG
jgi:adenylate cyclase